MEAENFPLNQLKILSLIAATKLRNTAQDFLHKNQSFTKNSGFVT